MEGEDHQHEEQERFEDAAELFFASTERANFELQRVPPRERDGALDNVWARRPAAAGGGGGVNDADDNNSSILHTMQRHVTQHRMKPAFYKVLFLNPLYAYNMDLLKLFYNPNDFKLAAQQYCQHWELKLKYFGLEQLPKPLSAKDSLLPQDKACLYSGSMQLFRDDHGRIVLCLLPSLLSKQQAIGGTTTNEHQNECHHLVSIHTCIHTYIHTCC